MGYEVYITKKANWFDDGEEISKTDWENYVNLDKTMQIVSEVTSSLDDGLNISYGDSFLTKWISPENNEIWFDFNDGNITVKNPTERDIIKMLEIAKQLNAKVQGDDGEFYG
jgi:hypothetical protein